MLVWALAFGRNVPRMIKMDSARIGLFISMAFLARKFPSLWKEQIIFLEFPASAAPVFVR